MRSLSANLQDPSVTAAAPGLIRATQLKRNYQLGPERVRVLDGIDLDVQPGEFLAIFGPSGSGKSTLLSILGALDVGYEGRLSLFEIEPRALTMRARAQLRAEKIGFVFQDFRLLPQLSASANVEAPLHLLPLNASQRAERTRHALALVGMENRGRHRPDQLSGGERQRVAIARAIAGGAELIVCDEPTGNLNRSLSESIWSLLSQLRQDYGKTVVLATHDESAVRHSTRVLTLTDGQLAAVS